MNEPLTRDHFERWREREFVPHTVAEEAYEKKVDALDGKLAMWLKVVSVALGMGGAVIGIFLWILLEKNAQLTALQMSQSATQAAVVAIATEHKQVIATIDQLRATDAQIMTTFIEHAKAQNVLMVEVLKARR